MMEGLRNVFINGYATFSNCFETYGSNNPFLSITYKQIIKGFNYGVKEFRLEIYTLRN